MSGGVWAVIPVKPLRGALRRLRPALNARMRRELQVAMLTDVLTACAGARSLEGVLVVTSDPDATALAGAIAGARVVPDHDPPRGMNAAVARGLAAVAADGAGAALVLTADIPLLHPDDLDAIVAVGAPDASVLIVPSHEGTGTNAMLMRPPQALAPRLGPDSLARHTAQARRRGLTLSRLERPRVGLDIDTPADVVVLMSTTGGSCATLEVCMRLGIADHLEAGSAL